MELRLSDDYRTEYLLEQLIKFRQNDMILDMDSGYRSEEGYENLTSLIISVTRYVNDIRYCSKADCSCSPESDIKFYYEKTKHFLQGTNTALHPIPWKTIEVIIKEVKHATSR